MTSISLVRRAVPADRESIWDLFWMLHAENGIFTVSERKLNWLLDRMLHPERIPEDDTGLRGYIGVIGPEGDIEGFIILILGSLWYSDEIYLEELANFVHPNHRKSNHAKTLLGWSRQMSNKVGVPLLIGIISNTRTQAKVRLYRKFLPEAGAFFLYNATTTRFQTAYGTNGERPALGQK